MMDIDIVEQENNKSRNDVVGDNKRGLRPVRDGCSEPADERGGRAHEIKGPGGVVTRHDSHNWTVDGDGYSRGSGYSPVRLSIQGQGADEDRIIDPKGVDVQRSIDRDYPHTTTLYGNGDHRQYSPSGYDDNDASSFDTATATAAFDIRVRGPGTNFDRLSDRSGSPSASEAEVHGTGRRISIRELLSGPSPNPNSPCSSSVTRSILPGAPSISPATPIDPYEFSKSPYSGSPRAYHHPETGTIHSPGPLPPPLRSRSSLGDQVSSTTSTIRGPIRTSARPRPIASPHSHSYSFQPSRRASPYNLPGLGIKMLSSPSTSASISPMDSPLRHSHANSNGDANGLRINPSLNSPGSMSARRRGPVPQWPSPKSSRSHSFNSSVHTPRDLYQTLRTPAALRVPGTPFYQHQQSTPIPSCAHGQGQGARRGIGAGSSAPPLSAARIEAAAQIPTTPGRIHLVDVPRAQVISTLNERAGKYWFDPASADCNLYVPVSRKKYAPPSPVDGPEGQSSTDNSPSNRTWPPCPDPPSVPEGIDPCAGNLVTSHRYHNGRRGSMPQDDDVPVMIFPVHRDYLITQSRLLLTVLSATSPTRATFPSSPTTPQPRSFPNAPNRPPVPRAIRGARILPPKEGEPISIFLPIPDPASFGIVLHWLYWGDTVSLERSFTQGLATWQGVVKNIEYLALGDNIKRVMGKWWRTWVKTDVGRRSSESASARPATVAGPPLASSRKDRQYSVSSESASATDDEREEDGMEVDERKEEDDGGVGDLLKKL